MLIVRTNFRIKSLMVMGVSTSMTGVHLKTEVVTMLPLGHISNFGIFNIGFKFNKDQFYHFMEDPMIIIRQVETKLIK